MFLVRKLLQNGVFRKEIKRIIRKNSSVAENIVSSKWDPIEFPEISIGEQIQESCLKWPNKIATECGITGRKYTFEEVLVNARNLNRQLRKNLKLKKGDVCGMLLPNCPEVTIVVLGVTNAGLILTTLNPLYTQEEISRQLKDSSTKVLITTVELYDIAKKSAALINSNIPILAIRTKSSTTALPAGAINFFEFLEKTDYQDIEPPKHEDTAVLPYSSGTTGVPKGVHLTHYNLVVNFKQFETATVWEKARSDFQETVIMVLPQFHIYGFAISVMAAMNMGAKVVTLPSFTPDSYVEALRKYRPTQLPVVPPLALFLSQHPMVKAEDLHSIKVLSSGAAPLGLSDEERFLEKAGRQVRIMQAYGLTETSPLVTAYHPEQKRTPENGGNVGTAIANTFLKIVDPDDPDEVALGPNQTGELLIKGPQVMKGYHNKPKETAEAFSKDGWFRSGDLMYYNEDRLFFVKDRLKELIKVKGLQVAPAELEEIIRSHPDVADAAVIGVPDPRSGELPRAYIVAKPGKSVNVEKINEFMSKKVAPHKQLAGGIEVVETIPKNPAGKILRRVLKQRYEKGDK